MLIFIAILFGIAQQFSCLTINSPCHPNHTRIQHDIAVISSNSRIQKRGASSLEESLWPNGTIPYQISKSFPKHISNNIRTAMATWESHTCLHFVRLTDQPFGLHFEPQDCGCCSFVGRQQFTNSKPQGISINGQDCDDVGSILHEIGHALGFWHEHARPDRDKFVRVLYQNIRDDSLHNFERKNDTVVDSLGMRYDYQSIMHYGRQASSIGYQKSTLVPKKSKHLSIGQRVELSIGDIRQTNKLYGCSVDEDQCSVDNGRCDHYCTDLPRGRKCSCRRGYVAHGTTCTLACDRWLEEPEGIIYSVNYPEKYPPGITCSWDIRAPGGYYVRLRFLKFLLEDSKGCVFDAVHVRRFNLTLNAWETVAVLCGSEPTKRLVVKSEVVRVLFKSDRTVSRSGFKIAYSFVKSLCLVQPRKCGDTLPQRYFLPAAPVEGGGCSREVVGREGEISLPSSPPFFCSVKVRARGDRRVVLVVRELELTETPSCERENLWVEGRGVFCGQMNSHVIKTAARLVRMTIKIDRPESRIRLSFYTVP